MRSDSINYWIDWSVRRQTRAARRRCASIVRSSLADRSRDRALPAANPLSGDDPAYSQSAKHRTSTPSSAHRLSTGSESWITIDRYAEGVGEWRQDHPSRPPTRLADLTQLCPHARGAPAAAVGPGFGAVARWSVWNEPNLQSSSSRRDSTRAARSSARRRYVKLWMAAYNGIKAEQFACSGCRWGDVEPRAQPSDRRQRGISGTSDSCLRRRPSRVSLREVAPRLPFVAWAEHLVSSASRIPPRRRGHLPRGRGDEDRQVVGTSLQQWFHRRVPVLGDRVGPSRRRPSIRKGGGINHAQQAKGRQDGHSALASEPIRRDVRAGFIFRDSTSQAWFSGIENKTGARKPAYSAWVTAAKATDGQSIVVAPNRTFTAKIAVPLFSYYDTPGTPIGVT